MRASFHTPRRTPSVLATPSLVAAASLLLAACGSASSYKGASSATPVSAGGATTTTAPPGTMFSAASVPGLGMAVVDGRGRTVYLLSAGDHKNVPCEDSTGCTKVWPDLPLPDGTSAATAGPGLQGSLLGTMKLSDGETYPTYGGWLMYEYVGDSGPGTANGEGITSFGGTWSAISPAGTPVLASAVTTTTSSPPATSLSTTPVRPASAPTATVAPATPVTTQATARTVTPTSERPSPTTSPSPTTTKVTTPCAYPPCY